MLPPERVDSMITYFQNIYSSMETQQVLLHFFRAVQTEFPGCICGFWLSHDNLALSLPAEVVDMGNPDNEWIQMVFTSGQAMQHPDGRQVALPLAGKQGVYGVLTLQCDKAGWLNGEHLYRVSLLSHACGTAFENARLYEQANQLIDELNVINEVTKKLTRHLKKEEILSLMGSEVNRIFQTDASFSFDLEGRMVTSFPPHAFELSEAELPLIRGLIRQVSDTGEGLIFADLAAELKGLSPPLSNCAYRSLVAMPMATEGCVVIVFFALSKRKAHFTYQQFRLLRSLMDITSLSMKTAMLHHQVHQLAVTDYLTKLFARSYLDEQVRDSLKKDPHGSFVLIDIDSFKMINDTFGHQTGDDILVQVAQIIKESVRQKTDIAARWGGEEMVLYLPNIQPELACQIADRIRQQVESRSNPRVTVSCGISSWTKEHPTSLDNLFRMADKALYQAKRIGKNCIRMAGESWA